MEKADYAHSHQLDKSLPQVYTDDTQNCLHTYTEIFLLCMCVYFSWL